MRQRQAIPILYFDERLLKTAGEKEEEVHRS